MIARRLAGLAALAALLAAVPAARAQAPPDLTNAAAAILIDARDGKVLLDKNAEEQRAIASTTKLMTALLALERARPRERFVAPRYDALPVESKINLRAGESMTVADLLEALLLESANDAAVTLAEGVSGSRRAFVAEMNARAEDLGLADTSYANPIGLDDPLNYSTARDLSALAARLLHNRRFARTVDMPSAVLASGALRRIVDNRNVLVGEYPFVDGVKTGFTARAGNVLVGSGSKRGAQVISVVMGEPTEAQRDADTLALLRYGLGRYRRSTPVRAGRRVATARLRHREGERVDLVPTRTVTRSVRRGEPATICVVGAPRELDGPLPARARVGTVEVRRRGRTVDRVALVTAAAVAEAGITQRLDDVLGRTLLVLGVGAFALASLQLLLLRRRARRRRSARPGGTEIA